MKTPLYRQALSHSWHLAWKHVWLWPLGLFAAFLGQMGIVEFLSKIGFSVSSVSPLWFVYQFSSISTATGPLVINSTWMTLIWLILLLLALIFGVTLVSVISQGALVHITARSVKTRSKKLPSIEKSWHAGATHFWRLLFLNLIKIIIIGGLSVCIGWAAFNTVVNPALGDFFMFLAVFVLAAIVGMVLSFLVIYAAGYVVIEEYKFWDAIHAAWRLFVDHWLVSLEVGIIIMFLNVLLALVGLLGIFLIFLPTLFIWLLASALGSVAIFTFGAVLALALSLLFIIFLGSVFTVFTTSTWTYLFIKMYKKGIKSRILHLFR